MELGRRRSRRKSLPVPRCSPLDPFRGRLFGDESTRCRCGNGVARVCRGSGGGEVTGVDLAPELVEKARQNALLAGLQVAFRLADTESLPFPDASFDMVPPNLVICSPFARRDAAARFFGSWVLGAVSRLQPGPRVASWAGCSALWRSTWRLLPGFHLLSSGVTERSFANA